ncbi:Cytoplasmic 60S subunit biogenesis factor [Neolecta irregularis DAH-3]|uniref:Cytoplasmic 60S subunit biogenesis factor n=1 Tax=Neolecta irregularis (strain DAH-3) TaxID=1198029 RepID=A0A1U7LGI8_NEOID|nr:Cytoplasmic 60S subunit biogenesis factor [Neolecta irregularis DAH-3]|eukprot:OLL21662.1 Cytoplasmic 60S subunit biogenesis factor [Neolecta irregularis DAH-3]
MTTHLYTCLACSVGFHTPYLQRDHYRTDWHRYNLKRKVADMPPVTAEIFAQKAIAAQDQSNAEVEKANFVAECRTCSKTYYSENAYANHLSSKRHKSLSKDRPDNLSSVAVKPVKITKSETEDISIEDQITQKLANACMLSPEECLFCTHKAETPDANSSHMKNLHGLFIPESNFLTDLPGLLRYLAEKVAIGNVCLYCQKLCRTLESVRNHMVDKAHCKIAYEDENSQLEISDFYDFRGSYDISDTENPIEGEDCEDWESVSNDSSLDSSDIGQLQTDTYALSLPSGRVLGHRSLRTYYRQYLSRPPVSDATNTHRAIKNGKPSARDLSMIGVSASQRRWAEKHINTFVDHRRREDFKTMMAFRNNHQFVLSETVANL